MDNRLKKWNKWLGIINSEVTRLSTDRYMFWEVQEIIRNNPKIQNPDAFHQFFAWIYANSSLMGIRRQVKLDKQSISMARLLKEISDEPELLSRKRFVDLYKGSTVEDHADVDFDHFAGKDGDHVDGDLVNGYLKALQAKARKCEKYADRRVAHIDKREPKMVPKFKDIDDCIDILEKILKELLYLFEGSAPVEIRPDFQFDWTAIFREPWLPQMEEGTTP